MLLPMVSLRKNTLLILAALACAALPGVLLAQVTINSATTLFLADGDASATAPAIAPRLAAINTTTGATLYTVDTGYHGNALAVTDRIWMLDHYNNPGSAHSFGLDGTSGRDSSTFTPLGVSQFLDGTTNGIFNYTLAWTGGDAVVYRANTDWTNLTSIFTATGSDIAGIAYDMATDTLWISGNSTIYQYSLTGTVLGQFSHTGGRGGLAYQPSTDSLWLVPNNASSPLLQYSKTGTLLQSLTVTGRSSNVWGAEFIAVPEPSTYALLALGLGWVFWVRRRRGAQR